MNMEVLACCLCRQPPDLSLSFFTCGHFCCSSHPLPLYCPIDQCDILPPDPTITDLLARANLSRPQGDQPWDQYIVELHTISQVIYTKYPYRCDNCGQHCRPDGCFQCAQRSHAHSGTNGTGHRTRNTGARAGCECTHIQLCSLCTLIAELSARSSTTWTCSHCRNPDNNVFVGVCNGCRKARERFRCVTCGKGVEGLQFPACKECAKVKTNFVGH